MNKILIQLGNLIVERRNEIGITAVELALRTDIDKSNMCRIEKGRQNLSFINLVKIANALDISVSELLINFKP